MITIDASHIVPGTCPPYPIRPKQLKCPLLSSTVAGEQPPESPVDDIFPKDSEMPVFGCQGESPPKEGVSLDFNAPLESGMDIVNSDPVIVS